MSYFGFNLPLLFSKLVRSTLEGRQRQDKPLKPISLIIHMSWQGLFSTVQNPSTLAVLSCVWGSGVVVCEVMCVCLWGRGGGLLPNSYWGETSPFVEEAEGRSFGKLVTMCECVCVCV